MWTIAAAVTNDRSLADDIVQDAASIALSKLHEFTPGTRFVAWMGQIVRYVALNESRKKRSQRSAGDEPLGSLASRDVPAYAAFDARVAAALESLDETPRACIVMRTVQDLPYSTIAAALGIPEGTAMSHVHRARAILRERLASLAPGGAA
jgi:RNA polymerase sigma-70 factor (ECF subfamily)